MKVIHMYQHMHDSSCNYPLNKIISHCYNIRPGIGLPVNAMVDRGVGLSVTTGSGEIADRVYSGWMIVYATKTERIRGA